MAVSTPLTEKTLNIYPFGEALIKSYRELLVFSNSQAPGALSVAKNWNNFDVQGMYTGCYKGCLCNTAAPFQCCWPSLPSHYGRLARFCQAAEPEKKQHCAAFALLKGKEWGKLALFEWIRTWKSVRKEKMGSQI